MARISILARFHQSVELFDNQPIAFDLGNGNLGIKDMRNIYFSEDLRHAVPWKYRTFTEGMWSIDKAYAKTARELCKHHFKDIDSPRKLSEDRVIYGGGDRYLMDFAHHLQQDGHEVTVFEEYGPVPGFNGPYEQQIVKEYEGVKFVCMFQQPNNGVEALNRNFNQLSVYADLRVYFVSSLCVPEVRNPAVAISHGIFWDSPYLSYKDMTREQRFDWLQKQMIGFTLPDYVVAVDHNVRNVIQAIEPGAECRITVIPNYVDTKKFHPKEKDWEGIRVLFARRSTLIRGWNLFSTAAKNLPQYEFIACGDATRKDQQDDLEAAASRAIPNLRQTHKHMNDMPAMYQSVDINTVPTMAAEGLSLSLLEGMACGLPTITTNVGGIGDATLDRLNSFIFNPYQQDMTDAVRLLAENEGLRKELGAMARETSLRFDENEVWWPKWRQIIPPKVTP